MANIRICISDNFKNFEYVFSFDENTTIFAIKENLATILDCRPDNICLANEGIGLDDRTTLKELNPTRSAIINLSASAILVSEFTAGTAPISALEENLLTPATLLWMEWADKIKPKNILPLRAITAYSGVLAGGGVFSFLKEKGVDLDRSKGIPIAIPMSDLECCVQKSIRIQGGSPINFSALMTAWGIYRLGAISENVLTFSDFERLMELFSIPESHFIFSEAARAAVQKANELKEAGLITNIAQHVAQALLPLAGQIFADAVNSSLGSGARGAFVGFLPRKKCEEALNADGRTGSFLLRFSGTKACQLVLSFIEQSETSGISSRRIVHQILSLSPSRTGYICRGIEYDSFSKALASLKSFLKHPCLIAALAIRVGTIEGAIRVVPRKNTPLWVRFNTLRQEGCGKLDATFNTSSMDIIKEEIDRVHQFEPIKYATDYDNSYGETIFNMHIMARLTPEGFSRASSLQRYYFQAFHGVLDGHRTSERLSNRPAGTYLLRNSVDKSDSFILAFVDSTGRIQQTIISPDMRNSSRGGVTCSGRFFSSLHEVISTYSAMGETSSATRNFLHHGLIHYANDGLITEAIPWNEQFLFETESDTAVVAPSSTDENPINMTFLQTLKSYLRISIPARSIVPASPQATVASAFSSPARTQALAVTDRDPASQDPSPVSVTTIVRQRGIFAVAPQVADPALAIFLSLPGLESLRPLLETVNSSTLNAPGFRVSLEKLSSDFLMQESAKAAAASATANYNKSLGEMMNLILATPSDTLEAETRAARASH